MTEGAAVRTASRRVMRALDSSFRKLSPSSGTPYRLSAFVVEASQRSQMPPRRPRLYIFAGSPGNRRPGGRKSRATQAGSSRRIPPERSMASSMTARRLVFMEFLLGAGKEAPGKFNFLVPARVAVGMSPLPPEPFERLRHPADERGRPVAEIPPDGIEAEDRRPLHVVRKDVRSGECAQRERLKALLADAGDAGTPPQDRAEGTKPFVEREDLLGRDIVGPARGLRMIEEVGKGLCDVVDIDLHESKVSASRNQQRAPVEDPFGPEPVPHRRIARPAH